MKLLLLTALVTLSASSFAKDLKEPVLKGILKTESFDSEREALVSAFEMEDAIVAGENQMATRTAKVTCAGLTKNVEYTKNHVRLDKVYVDSVAKYTAIVVYNYTCNIFKR